MPFGSFTPTRDVGCDGTMEHKYSWDEIHIVVGPKLCCPRLDFDLLKM